MILIDQFNFNWLITSLLFCGVQGQRGDTGPLGSAGPIGKSGNNGVAGSDGQRGIPVRIYDITSSIYDITSSIHLWHHPFHSSMTSPLPWHHLFHSSMTSHICLLSLAGHQWSTGIKGRGWKFGQPWSPGVCVCGCVCGGGVMDVCRGFGGMLLFTCALWLPSSLCACT